jgi:hypothetical protein
MRAIILLVALLVSGCKTAEFALCHPGTGMHLVAKLEARETPPPKPFYTYPASPVVVPTVPMATSAPALLPPTPSMQAAAEARTAQAVVPTASPAPVPATNLPAAPAAAPNVVR